MFQRILVPLDASELAEQSLPVAARLARGNQGTIVLLEAVAPPIEFGPYIGTPPIDIQTAIDTDTAAATAYLQDAARKEAVQGLKTETKVEFGWPAAVILAVAENDTIDLIVMSSHGRSGLGRWIMGSVAHRVVRNAPVPVLVLRDEALPTAVQRADIRPHALVTIDGSKHSESILPVAAQTLAALTSDGGEPAVLHLFYVVDQQPGTTKSEGMVKQASAYLAMVAEQLQEGAAKGLNLSIAWSVAADKDIASTIVKVAEAGEGSKQQGAHGPCDLIMMAASGHGGGHIFGVGSITERVLNSTKLPLLIVRPQ